MLGLWRLSDTDGVGTRHEFPKPCSSFRSIRFMLHVRVAAALFSRPTRHLVLLTNVWWDNGVAVAWFSAGRELKRCRTQLRGVSQIAVPRPSLPLPPVSANAARPIEPNVTTTRYVSWLNFRRTRNAQTCCLVAQRWGFFFTAISGLLLWLVILPS